jgi:hypothetical protein
MNLDLIICAAWRFVIRESTREYEDSTLFRSHWVPIPYCTNFNSHYASLFAFVWNPLVHIRFGFSNNQEYSHPMDVVHTQRKMAYRSRPVESTDDDGNTDGAAPTAAAAAASESPKDTSKANGHQNGAAAAQPIRRGPLQRLRRRRAASKQQQEHLRPARQRLLEEHYRVDADQHLLLPGVPKHDPDWARDSHDFFNLVVLVPLVALNVMNWNWDMIFNMPKNKIVTDAWTGEWWDMFFLVTVLYFTTDLCWVVFIPECVRSPGTIIKHHLLTLLYIVIPYCVPECRPFMGCCLSVEINTWFLIARRVFNKQGFPPWIIDLSFFSIRVKLISVLFYVTWIGFRCILYPYLMIPFYQAWVTHTAKVGTPWNIVFMCVPLHAFFCLLNLKWSYDLLMSKVRYWRLKGNYKDASVSKGL